MFSDLSDEEFMEIYASKMAYDNHQKPRDDGVEERRQLRSFLDDSRDPRFKREFERLKYKNGQGQ